MMIDDTCEPNLEIVVQSIRKCAMAIEKIIAENTHQHVNGDRYAAFADGKIYQLASEMHGMRKSLRDLDDMILFTIGECSDL